MFEATMPRLFQISLTLYVEVWPESKSIAFRSQVDTEIRDIEGLWVWRVWLHSDELGHLHYCYGCKLFNIFAYPQNISKRCCKLRAVAVDGPCEESRPLESHRHRDGCIWKTRVFMQPFIMLHSEHVQMPVYTTSVASVQVNVQIFRVELIGLDPVLGIGDIICRVVNLHLRAIRAHDIAEMLFVEKVVERLESCGEDVGQILFRAPLNSRHQNARSSCIDCISDTGEDEVSNIPNPARVIIAHVHQAWCPFRFLAHSL